jgi:hypothetical protein
VAIDEAARKFGANIVGVVRTSQKAVADSLSLVGEDVEVVEELFPC